jgi:hypothetical protein
MLQEVLEILGLFVTTVGLPQLNQYSNGINCLFISLPRL